MKKVLYFFSLLLLCCTANGQFNGLIINEFSQGNAGEKEYIELLVVGTRTCTETTADLRGWIIDDQNQWYGNESNAPGHFRFNINNPMWQNVPIGSLIVIYNPNDKNSVLPPDIVDPVNFKYIIPIDGSSNGISFFERDALFPVAFLSGTSYQYPSATNTTNYSTPLATSWESSLRINNSGSSSPGDVLSTISPTKRAEAFFSIGHGFPITNGYRLPSVSINVVQGGNVAFLLSEKYTDASSWAVEAVSGNETPGEPNTVANQAWITSLRTDPLPPIIMAAPSSTEICSNDSVTLTASGALTYFWSANVFPSGLSSNTGSSVKAKPPFTNSSPSSNFTYTVTGTDANGCTAEKTITITVKRPPEPLTFNQPHQRFCNAANPTINDLQPNGPSIKWYNSIDSKNDKTPLPGSTRLETKSYFATQTVNGCESDRRGINVTVNPTPIVSLTPIAFCSNTNSGGQMVFTGTPGAIVTFSVNGIDSTVILISGRATITPPNITSDITYTLKGITLNNCTGTANGSATIKYLQLQKPNPPLNQKICGYPQPKISDLTPSGSNYNWYNNITDVTPLNPTENALGKSYYVSEVDLLSGCESERAQIYANIDVVTSPSADAQSFCASGNPTVADLKGNNMVVSWYEKNDDDHRKPLPPTHVLTSTTYYARQFSNSCYSENIIPVSVTVNPSPLKPDAYVSKQPTCSSSTGTIIITSPSKAAGITYRLQKASFFVTSDDPVFTNVAPGTYDITYTINGGCSSFVETVTVDNAPTSTLSATATASPIPCGQSSGLITVNAINGLAPYSFSINNGINYQQSNVFSNLAAGSHTIKVRDNTGCTYDVTATIAQNNSTVTATANTSPISCGQSTGTITINASNGATPYTYSINGTSYQTSNVFSNLSSGSYTVRVRDNNGCTFDVTATITQTTSTVTATASVSQISCGQTTGTITVNASSGAPPYTYSINNGITYQQSNIFSNLATGSYSVRVKDNTGCTFDVSATINQNATAVTATATAPPISCGQSTGTITVNASNGTAPYSYSINNGTSYQQSNIFTNLSTGSYSIRVRDNSGCTFDVSVTITQNTPSVTATATTTDTECGKSNGSITASGTGGSSYTYSLNNGAFGTGNVFNNLAAGTYKITVQNSSGCSDDTVVVIKPITSAVTQSSTLSGCKSVVFNGITYTSSTIVKDTLRNSINCDSVYRITNVNVQNTPVVTRTQTINGCNSVVLNNISYKNSTTVKDTLKTTAGCDSIYVVTTINISTSNLALTASANPAFAGTTVTLTTSSSSGYRTIAWQPAHLFPLQTASTQRITADTSRMIKVIAESNAGCIDTAQLFVEVKEFTDFFIPNAFTPNGDGKNDLFLLMGTTINKGRIRIFNQWGEMLFATEDVRKGWDGTFKGKPQPVGIYVYEVHVTMNNGTEIKKKGFINLIR
jgi:gliding motility-associated-like protein